MKDLNHLRQQIDAIDEQLTKLWEQRMQAAADIVRYKQRNHLPVLNGGREQQVIANAKGHLTDATLAPYLEQFYAKLMEGSRAYQMSLLPNVPTIGYQGVAGSFSHEASLRYAQNTQSAMKNYQTFSALCMGLLNGEVDCVVIPVENSSTGSVVDVYDLLLQHPFYIIGEVCVRVNHNLVAKPGTKIEDITEVYSHPQGFMQCKEFLSNYSWKQIPHQNTAIAAQYVAEQASPHMAAIASVGASETYGLNVIASQINFNSNNITRFIVLSKKLQVKPENNKISVILTLENKPGSLFQIMKRVDQCGANLLKIESRPDPGNPFHYIFFIDLEGNPRDPAVGQLLDALKLESKEYRLLGSYCNDMEHRE